MLTTTVNSGLPFIEAVNPTIKQTRAAARVIAMSLVGGKIDVDISSLKHGILRSNIFRTKSNKHIEPHFLIRHEANIYGYDEFLNGEVDPDFNDFAKYVNMVNEACLMMLKIKDAYTKQQQLHALAQKVVEEFFDSQPIERETEQGIAIMFEVRAIAPFAHKILEQNKPIVSIVAEKAGKEINNLIFG